MKYGPRQLEFKKKLYSICKLLENLNRLSNILLKDVPKRPLCFSHVFIDFSYVFFGILRKLAPQQITDPYGVPPPPTRVHRSAMGCQNRVHVPMWVEGGDPLPPQWVHEVSRRGQHKDQGMWK